MHSSPLCSWKDSNISSFFLAPPLIIYLIVWWLAKNLYFFMEIYYFLVCLLHWTFSYRTSILGRGLKQKNRKQKHFWDKFKGLWGNSSFGVPRKSGRKSCCLPDTMIHLYWKTMGWIQRQIIKLRVLLQNFSTTFCTTGCQRACWAECYITG